MRGIISNSSIDVIFGPAIALQNRLRFREKFAALATIAMIAVIVSLIDMYLHLRHEIDNGVLQLQGIPVVDSVSRSVRLIQEHRGLMAGKLVGMQNSAQLLHDIEPAIDIELSKLQSTMPPSLNNSEGWINIVAIWRDIQKVEFPLTPTESFRRHTELIESLLDYKSTIADEFGLATNREVGSHYLMEVNFFRLARSLELLGQIRAIGTSQLAQADTSEQDRRLLSDHLREVERSLRVLKLDLEKVGRIHSRHQSQLNDVAAKFKAASEKIIEMVNVQLLENRRSLSPMEFFNLTSAAIDLGYQQSDLVLAPVLLELVQASILEARVKMAVSLGSSLILMLAAAWLSIGLYISAMRSIKKLTKGAHEFAGGSLETRITLQTNDELHEVADSFNVMAREFSDLLAGVELTNRQLRTMSIAIEQSPTAVAITSLAGMIEYVNPAFSGVTGYSSQDAVGRNANMLYSGHTARVVYEELWACISRGATWSGVLVNRRKNGDLYWDEAHISPVRDETGQATHFVAVMLDITERHLLAQRDRLQHRIFEALAASAAMPAMLQMVIECMEICKLRWRCAIVVPGSNGGLEFIAEHAKMVDVIADSAPSCNVAQLQMLEDSIGLSPWMSSALSGKRGVWCQTPSQAGNAEQDPHGLLAGAANIGACWTEPVRNETGEVVAALLVYIQQALQPELSDLRLMAEMAQLAGEVIDRKDANEKLLLASLVYQNSSDAMTVTDPSGKIITINPAFTAVTGYQAHEVVGKNMRILSSGRQDAGFYQTMWHTLNMTGQWKGEIWNRRKDGEIYIEWLNIDTSFHPDGSPHRRVALFSDISDRKKQEELIWNQANFDSLTGLPNRRMFLDRLGQEIKKSNRAGQNLAVMLLDLDRFKEINDTQGHQAGDQLLKETAQRILSCVRDTDTVARLGGDEFAIILTELGDAAYSERVAESILKTLFQPFTIDTETVHISASIGITTYPNDADTVETLIKNADQAMYAAKGQGRNRFNYFTQTMQDAAQSRMRISTDLRTAAIEGQLRLLYQPITTLGDGSIHKAEALIRWEHPKFGMINPAEFIPIAEENGTINEIGDWVFQEAARQAHIWRAEIDPRFTISINVSPIQMHNAGGVSTAWFDYLAGIDLEGKAIVIEITEGLLMDNLPEINEKLKMLHQTGMRIALDDFGTGYSSLSYLKKFDIDFLKIDQSFVRNLSRDSHDMVVCDAIIAMAHKLGMRVIAEGIETVVQRDLLIAAGCDFGQGYYFSRPITAAQFEAMLVSQELVD